MNNYGFKKLSLFLLTSELIVPLSSSPIEISVTLFIFILNFIGVWFVYNVVLGAGSAFDLGAHWSTDANGTMTGTSHQG